MKQSHDMGMNRTGIGMEPGMSEEMVKHAKEGGATAGDPHALSAVRHQYEADAPPVGSAPPPPSAKGMAQSGVEMLKGHKPTVLLDQLGDRLAFERTGVRLYEALIDKFDSQGTWDEGPTREELVRFKEEEAEHFAMVKEAIESMGGDPTSMTPSADVSGVASEGIVKVITDPRTSLVEALHAIHIAELTDNDGWDMLIKLTDGMGQSQVSETFGKALQQEQVHLSSLRRWLTSALESEAHRSMQQHEPPVQH